MGLDTKTYWLTDRQSQCDFDFIRSQSAWEHKRIGRIENWVKRSQRGQIKDDGLVRSHRLEEVMSEWLELWLYTTCPIKASFKPQLHYLLVTDTRTRDKLVSEIPKHVTICSGWTGIHLSSRVISMWTLPKKCLCVCIISRLQNSETLNLQMMNQEQGWGSALRLWQKETFASADWTCSCSANTDHSVAV
jgi:hypothetical protein